MKESFANFSCVLAHKFSALAGGVFETKEIGISALYLGIFAGVSILMTFPFPAGSDKNRVTLTHETYLLQAGSEDERKFWVQAIKKVMFGSKGGGKSLGNLRSSLCLSKSHSCQNGQQK